MEGGKEALAMLESEDRATVLRGLVKLSFHKENTELMKQAMPKVLALFGHKDKAVRMNATRKLAELPPDILKPFMQKLINLLGSSDSFERMNAAEAICLIAQEHGRDLVPSDVSQKLIELLDDKVWQVRRAAAKALGEVGGLSALMELNKLTKKAGENSHVVSEAANAIRKIENRWVNNALKARQPPANTEGGGKRQQGIKRR